jgi:UDP-hydrolysing UDP-N-acetyl-D-glucosamine 2-epimerase
MKKLLISVTNRSSYNKVKTIVQNLPRDIQVTFLMGNSINLYRYGGIGLRIQNDFPEAKHLRIHLAVEGDDLHKMSKTVGMGILEVATILDNQHFDAVLTVADRFETMAIAIASSYANIPLIHLQGGETTGTIDNKVRHAISQLSDIHFPATKMSGIRLSQTIVSKHIYPYGCPSMDLLIADERVNLLRERACGRMETFPEYSHDDLIDYTTKLVNSTGTGGTINTGKPFIIVMFHGDTTDNSFEGNIYQLRDALNYLGMQEVVFWNNIDPKGDSIAKMWRERQILRRDHKQQVRYIRHLAPEDFGGLLMLSKCIVGNSSTGVRESSFLGVPSVNIGDRQHNREHGENCFSVTLYKRDIVDGVNYSRMQKQDGYIKPINMYGDGHTGNKIAQEIANVLRHRP